MGEAKRKKLAIASGAHVPERKFLSEFAIGLYTARWALIAIDQLHSGKDINIEAQKILDCCHIYMICRRPAVFFDKATFSYQNGIVSGKLLYRISGKSREIYFSDPFSLVDGASGLSLSYPYRQFETVNENPELVRHVPASVVGIVQPSGSDLRALEVLYVGQAYGDGSRTAFDRLQNHQTLQKILAENSYKYPDDEITVLMFEYKPHQIISSFDGSDKKAIRDFRDSRRLSKIINNQISEKQEICLAEAGLIRYFKPEYNITYKELFPSENQKILNGCYDLDFSALVVELDTTELKFTTYSEIVPPRQHHIAQYDLVNPVVRRSFFSFSSSEGGVFEMPGVIIPSS